jgi:hypothetical protein
MNRPEVDKLLFCFERENKIARIFETPLGFEVDLLDETGFRETRQVHENSVHYAEDVAENWCNGIIRL